MLGRERLLQMFQLEIFVTDLYISGAVKSWWSSEVKLKKKIQLSSR